MFWEMRDLKLFYKTIGSGTPVVMLHGFSLDHQMLEACMEPVFTSAGLAERYRRIYLDLPGMGKTAAVDWIMDADTVLEVLRCFLQAVIGDEPFLVVGESYGGYLARGLMHALPGRVVAAVLLCPVVYPQMEKRTLPEFTVRQRTGTEPFAGEAGYEAFCAQMPVQTPHTWMRYRDEIAVPSGAADFAYLIDFKQRGYTFSFPVDAPEQAEDFPVLIFTGRQDNFVGYEDAWQLRDRFPNASFAALNAAGHYLQIDQEAMFTAVLRTWLQALPAE